MGGFTWSSEVHMSYHQHKYSIINMHSYLPILPYGP